MIDISKIPLTLSQFANGGPVIATGIAPINPFRDGHSVTEEVVGRKITVVFPDNGYETQEIKVSDPIDTLTPLLKEASFSNPVFVDFPGFVGRVYLIRDKITGEKNLVISAKADRVRVVPAPGSDDDLVIE
ncbi:hypothetical protein D1641_15075 [Colidextribacter sp. OB.20]|uniref:hypothetical protein n=1 Tax=Colidextribacter sp. OB.20 TaxID=2304568 RepID=UPI001368BB6A|nr:hypothetical protein [Colidextribacter sp. OB.20]NBI11317.1 hypothetical protein [Colidextribacter sp. OB.20]